MVGWRARACSFESGSFRHSPDDRASVPYLHTDNLPIGGSSKVSRVGLLSATNLLAKLLPRNYWFGRSLFKSSKIACYEASSASRHPSSEQVLRALRFALPSSTRAGSAPSSCSPARRGWTPGRRVLYTRCRTRRTCGSLL